MGFINQLCGETPSDLRMGLPTPTTNCVGLRVILTETSRSINATYQSGQDVRMLEDWMDMQPQRFVMLWINADAYNVVVWIASQFFGPLSIW
jgi:hypothetical protein